MLAVLLAVAPSVRVLCSGSCVTGVDVARSEVADTEAACHEEPGAGDHRAGGHGPGVHDPSRTTSHLPEAEGCRHGGDSQASGPRVTSIGATTSIGSLVDLAATVAVVQPPPVSSLHPVARRSDVVPHHVVGQFLTPLRI